MAVDDFRRAEGRFGSESPVGARYTSELAYVSITRTDG